MLASRHKRCHKGRGEHIMLATLYACHSPTIRQNVASYLRFLSHHLLGRRLLHRDSWKINRSTPRSTIDDCFSEVGGGGGRLGDVHDTPNGASRVDIA